MAEYANTPFLVLNKTAGAPFDAMKFLVWPTLTAANFTIFLPDLLAAVFIGTAPFAKVFPAKEANIAPAATAAPLRTPRRSKFTSTRPLF